MILIMLACLSIISLLQANDLNRAEIANKLHQLVTPSFYNGVIHLEDLDLTSSSALITINAPGRYYVAGDLSVAPTNSDVAIIKITASNVLLDLNNTTIYPRAGNTQTGLAGIQVASNLHNVKIFNGRITGLNVADVVAQNAAIVIDSGAQNVTIEDVIASACTFATAEATGFLLNSCNNIKLINCESSANSNTKAGAADATGIVNGFKLSSCRSCVLQGCYASANASTSRNSYGFRLESSRYNKLVDCNAFYQTSTSASSGDLAAGFYSNVGVGNLFENCIAIGNTGGTNSGSMGVGFVLGDSTTANEKYSAIVHCRAEGNDGGTGVGYGINVMSGVNFCEVCEDILIGNTGTNSGYGIRDQNVQVNTNTLYIRNFAYANGKNDGTVINNYDISPAPSGTFQVKQGSYNNYLPVDDSLTGYFNVEIFQ